MVKSPHASLRAKQAAATRLRIAQAARVLFSERGYGATSLREVAAAAGVAVQTIYAVYGSKANIFRELRASVVMDSEADQAYRGALAELNPGHAIEAFARSIRIRWDAGHDVLAIGVEAASVDPAIRSEMAEILSIRRRGIERLARKLVQPPNPTAVAHVLAILEALTLPHIYAELVDAHGWSADEYEAWLATALKQLAQPYPEP